MKLSAIDLDSLELLLRLRENVRWLVVVAMADVRNLPGPAYGEIGRTSCSTVRSRWVALG